MICGNLYILLIFLVISTFNSAAQINAVLKELRKNDIKPEHIEGEPSCGWVLIDYGVLIMNLFFKDVREYYCLERIWSDAERIKI